MRKSLRARIKAIEEKFKREDLKKRQDKCKHIHKRFEQNTSSSNSDPKVNPIQWYSICENCDKTEYLREEDVIYALVKRTDFLIIKSDMTTLKICKECYTPV
jgi:hypothetical protein